MGISLHGDSVGQPGEGSFTGDFERWLKGTLEVGYLSLWELCDGNLEGGLLCWVPRRIGRKGSGDASISIGDPLGNLEGGSCTGDFERWLKGAPGKGHLSEVAHCGGPQERAPLLRTLGYEQKALGTDISLYGGPAGQPGVGSSTGNFERWLKGALEVGNHYGNSVKRTWKEGSLAGYPGGYVDMALEMGISFHRGPTGEPGNGLIYWGL